MSSATRELNNRGALSRTAAGNAPSSRLSVHVDNRYGTLTPPSTPIRPFVRRTNPTIKRRRKRLITLIVLFILSFVCLLSGPQTVFHVVRHYTLSWYRSGSAPSVCLVGNSETAQQALAVHSQWNSQFPAAFYVWGTPEEGEEQPKPPRNVLLIRTPGENLPFADGLYNSIKAVTAKFRCDYIFTHDDDLVFYLPPNATNPPDPSPQNLANSLVSLLDIYRPAIAGFPWAVGDDRFPEMIALKEAYSDSLVAPLTGFDNGMVIYHLTVLDFFFPFAPRGEGGFEGKWTLGAHFLQLFGPLIFREHAIRFNTIRYNNTVNLDNQPIVWEKVVISNGTAHVPWSRHPYEYPMNDAYQSFLKSGLKDRLQPWGRQLTIDDVHEPAAGSPYGYSDSWILNRLSQFYDVRHEALHNNIVVNRAKPQLLESLSHHPEITFKVIFFTKNRLRSFKRCWGSFQAAKKIQSRVEVEVYVDYDGELSTEVRIDYNTLLLSLEDFESPASKVEVFKTKTQKGLRKTILTSWNPTSNHEYAIFLEDDIEVSPYFLQYAEEMVKAYVYRDRADHRLHGISLYNLRYNEAIESFVSVDNNKNLPYIYQQAQSWGAIFLPEPWRQFLMYQKEIEKKHIDPLIPDSLTNRWPFQNSWKKTFMRFMVEKGGYFIYPNLPKELSFSTNHVEPGTNDKPTEDHARQLIHAKFKVPLLENLEQLPKDFLPFPTPPLAGLHTLNMRHEELENPNKLPSGEGYVQSFDKCTMIMTVFSRTATYMDRLDYYHTFSHLGQIVVIWNNMEITPRQLVYTNFSIPVEIILMQKNSMNNRFYPWPQIKYSCIINMDDDWDMPFAHMDYAIQTWRGHFWNHLVGFSHQGRNHVVRTVDDKDLTLYSPTFLSPQLLYDKTSYYSIVLPSGFIYHRKYLDVYTTGLPEAARNLVDRTMNCDDILFNYMMANETKSGPVVIDAWASMLKNLGEEGLWSRVTHMSDRTECMRALNEIFGFNPLRYTTTMFKIQSATTVPGLHHHSSQLQIPFDYPCNRSKYVSEGGCAMQMEKEYWDHAGGWV